MRKLRQPQFWSDSQTCVPVRLLYPISCLTHYLGQRRQARPSHKAAVPVLCIGNITVGGAGKTPLTMDFIDRLKKLGHTPHVITRGYGGQTYNSHRVDLQKDTVYSVGDEALLLARKATTWCGRDRVLSAENAIADGADCLILDDGFQDPSLYKDVSLLIFDGEFGLGNNHLLPAGPLREPLDEALKRTQGVIVIGKDRQELIQKLPGSLPYAHLSAYPRPEIRALQGKQLIAFAGIGRPEKFFTMLRESGLFLLHTIPFPDHHIYQDAELADLSLLAKIPGTALVTTEKDAIKLPPAFMRLVTTVKIDLYWDDPAMADQWLEMLLNQES